jgi:hypothetical protein
MSICNDHATTFLRKQGYNVVRHPSLGIRPLDLIGRQAGESLYLGHLNQLIGESADGLPKIEENIKSSDISGQSSSKMSIAIGANVLGNLIGAMGGTLGVTTTYTDAQRVEFGYVDVFNDLVVPLDVGNYLRDADVDAGNLILQQYILGRGELYLITKTAKSRQFSVKYERKNGTAAQVDLEVLPKLTGGNVTVDSSKEVSGLLTFSGNTPLVFGFQCFRVGVANGELALTSVRAGNIALAAGAAALEQPDFLADQGAVDLRFAI